MTSTRPAPRVADTRGAVGRRLVVAALSLLLLAFTCAVGLAGGAGQANAAPASDCTESSGVLVVVDFRHFGGAITRGCAPAPTNGVTALIDAGFDATGTQRYGLAFVCRIKGFPAEDPCFNTPSGSAYWSYWHADSGQTTWSYSTTGAASAHPGPGSIDAWVFGSGSAPTFTPAFARSGGSSPSSSPAASSPAPSSPGPSPSPTSSSHSTTSTATPAPATSRPQTTAPQTTAPQTTAPKPTAPTTTSPTSRHQTAPQTSAPPTKHQATTDPASLPGGTATASVSASQDPSHVAGSLVEPSAEPASPVAPSEAQGEPATGAPSSSASAGGLATDSAANSGSTASAPVVVDVAAGPNPSVPSHGSAWPAIIGGVLVLALVGAASWTAVRRRRLAE